MVKILKVEDLKNDDIVARIKKELSTQLSFSKGDAATAKALLKTGDMAEISVTNCPKKVKVDPEVDPVVAKSRRVVGAPKFVILSKSVSEERMSRFLSMTPEDVRPKQKKKLKCEVPISQLKKPVDTIRCIQCGVLYERDIYLAHTKTCKGNKMPTKFGCTICSFTHHIFAELEAHVREEHANK